MGLEIVKRASNEQAKQIEKQQLEEERAISNFKGYRPPVSAHFTTHAILITYAFSAENKRN